jgi:hypothetical protein
MIFIYNPLMILHYTINHNFMLTLVQAILENTIMRWVKVVEDISAKHHVIKNVEGQ